MPMRKRQEIQILLRKKRIRKNFLKETGESKGSAVFFYDRGDTMQETVVYLKKITEPEGGKKELERELSRCGWELFWKGMQEQYGLDGKEVKIERNAHGKPYLPEHPQICFNISHSGEYAACAFTAIPIGLDLQQHRRAAWERMAKRYFSVKDQARLAAAEDAETLFFQIWTEEESYGKWRGTGISGSLGTETKEGFCTHFCPAEGYEGAVWAADPLTVRLKIVES